MTLRCVLVSLALTLPSLAGSASSEWDRFLAHPSGATYAPLVALLSAGGDGACRAGAAPHSGHTLELIRLVDRRDAWAIDVAFASLHCLDGGDLEDVERSLAGIADVDGGLFLRKAKKHRLGAARLRGVVEKTPESTVDDTPAQIAALERRVHSLERVRDPALASMREDAIGGLRLAITARSRVEHDSE